MHFPPEFKSPLNASQAGQPILHQSGLFNIVGNRFLLKNNITPIEIKQAIEQIKKIRPGANCSETIVIPMDITPEAVKELFMQTDSNSKLEILKINSLGLTSFLENIDGGGRIIILHAQMENRIASKIAHAIFYKREKGYKTYINCSLQHQQIITQEIKEYEAFPWGWGMEAKIKRMFTDPNAKFF